MTTWENLCGAGQIDRHHFRVIKNRAYSAFWGFAMYVCTGSVRTYIAKMRNPLTIPDFGCSRSGNSQFNCSIRNASKKVGNSLSPFWQGKGVVLHDILLIWNNGFDFSFACDQIGHSQFKGVTNGYTLWSLSLNGSVPTLYIRT